MAWHSIVSWLLACPLTQSVQGRWIPIFGGTKSVNLRQVYLLDPSSPSFRYNLSHQVEDILGHPSAINGAINSIELCILPKASRLESDSQEKSKRSVTVDVQVVIYCRNFCGTSARQPSFIPFDH
ncbi:hypothetical protein F4814DRAFT_417516 [Daldinia grandis]|nr:hypothetical protein F4814DRAFT_417516 [Daldinia grandis]